MENVQNMKPVQFCTGFIIFTFTKRVTVYEALPGALRNRDKMAFILGEQWNKCQMLSGIGDEYNIGEQGTYENKF